MGSSRPKNEIPQKKRVKLGVDGKYLNGEDEIFVLGDVEEREFLGVTETNTSLCLQEALRTNFIDQGVELEVVNMDMDKRIKGAVRSVDENVPIVADKFHVITHTNRVIDLCRIAVEKSVNDRFEIKRTLLMKTKTFLEIKQQTKDFPEKNPKWEYKIKKFEAVLKSHPEIRILWDLKNKVHGFYRCKSIESATTSWIKLLKFIDDNTSIHPEFKDLKKTFLNWETEILNYFIFWTTNAYIEGLNNRIETLKRKKFGFRSKEKFLKCLCYLLFPITDVFQNLIFSTF